MKILIVADTHGLNNDKLDEIIKCEKCDINIHAGDYLISIDEMKKKFNYFVDGNNDYGYKNENIFSIMGFKFLLIHGHEYFNFDYEKWINKARKELIDFDVVIFGHSHIPLINTSSKPFFINPGSFSLPRKSNDNSYIIAVIENNKINFTLKYWK